MRHIIFTVTTLDDDVDIRDTAKKLADLVGPAMVTPSSYVDGHRHDHDTESTMPETSADVDAFRRRKRR